MEAFQERMVTEFKELSDDENYYYFTDMEGVMVGKWKNNPTDSWRYDFGNCFKSYEEAKEAINKIKNVLNL